jgi:prevent-host-death family protein
MSTISYYEARTHFSELLDQVAQGKRILITRHGRPAAMLTPPPDEATRDVKSVIAEIKALVAGSLDIDRILAVARPVPAR